MPFLFANFSDDFQHEVQDGCRLLTCLIFAAYNWLVCEMMCFCSQKMQIHIQNRNKLNFSVVLNHSMQINHNKYERHYMHSCFINQFWINKVFKCNISNWRYWEKTMKIIFVWLYVTSMLYIFVWINCVTVVTLIKILFCYSQ